MDQTVRNCHITVCVCTYKRPHMLRVLLENLEHQQTAQLFSYSVVIADNDRAQSGRSCVESYRAESELELHYCVEPEQNIALARNKALQQARGDYVAFIDDDEFPAQNWLLMLYRCMHAENVYGVLGPVLPQYWGSAPDWVRRGKFYDKQPPYPTGHVLKWTDTRTSNALVRRHLFSLPGNLFRPEFGSGGEDTDFFYRMIVLGGCDFIWCNEAVVFEAVPPERCTRSFMLRRALQRGTNTFALAAVNYRHLLKSCAASILYTLALPLLLPRHHVFMKILLKDAEHIGRLLALCRVCPYKRGYVME